jgi:hypothetical protein
MSDTIDLPALEMEARLKDFISQNIDTINKNITEFQEKSTESFGKVSAASTETESSFDKLSGAVKGLVAGYIGFEGAKKALDFLNESADKAQENVLAQTKLKTALGGDTTALLEQAEALEKVNLIGHVETEQADARLANYVKDESAIKKLMPVIQDLAKAKGMDLASASDLVGRTIDSETGTMGRLQIKIDGLPGSMDRVNSAVTELNKKFGGQAEALAKVDDGTQHLKIAWDNFMESVGEKMLPFTTKLKNFTAEVLGAMSAKPATSEQLNEALKKDEVELTQMTKGTVEYASKLEIIENLRRRISEIPMSKEHGQMGPPKPEPKISEHGTSTPAEPVKDYDATGDYAAWEERERSLHEKLAQDEENIDLKSAKDKQNMLKENALYLAEALKKETLLYEKASLELQKDGLDKNQLELLAIKEKYDKMEEAGVSYTEAEKARAMAVTKAWQTHAEAGLHSTVTSLDAMSKKWHEFGTAYKVMSEAENVINTYKAATASYSAMAGIPYVGPALGIAAAAVAVGAGVANGAEIASQSFSSGTDNAPGGVAKVHKDETIFLPEHSIVKTATESKNSGGDVNHFHFYGNADSATVDNIQSLLVEANRTGKLERFKAAIK